jgi:SARP family transcriptional regulator, regulator of embCAB operon
MALLAFLLLHANRAVSTDRLIDALWSEQDPAGAVKRVQVAIGRLRRVLEGDRPDRVEPVLRTVAGGYVLLSAIQCSATCLGTATAPASAITTSHV